MLLMRLLHLAAVSRHLDVDVHAPIVELLLRLLLLVVRVSKMLLMMLLQVELQVLGKLLLLLVGVPFVAGILLRMRMI